MCIHTAVGPYNSVIRMHLDPQGTPGRQLRQVALLILLEAAAHVVKFLQQLMGWIGVGW